MVDSGIDSDIPKASVTTNNYQGGYEAGVQMAKLLDGKGLVANLGIQAGSVSSQRSLGFNDAIAKYPNMKVLPTQWTNADAAASMNIASDQLNGNPNIAGFFSACAPTAVGVCQAIKAKGLEKKVKVVTFDPSPEILPLFESGVVDCIIAQDPYQMGYQGVDYIDKARKNTPIEKRKIELAPVLITPENYKSAEVQKLLQTPDKF
jgi:ribose transport system substrate-binding protein